MSIIFRLKKPVLTAKQKSPTFLTRVSVLPTLLLILILLYLNPMILLHRAPAKVELLFLIFLTGFNEWKFLPDSNEGPYLSQFYNMTIKVSDGMRQRYIAPNVERARESMKLVSYWKFLRFLQLLKKSFCFQLPHLAILTSNADSVNRITDVLHQVQEKSSVYQTNVRKLCNNNNVRNLL